jgi:hypothetical protein
VVRGSINAPVLSSSTQIWMASFIMYQFYFYPPAAESIPLQPNSPSVDFRWSKAVPGITLHREVLVFLAGCTGLSMTRPRGRPRQGSPWKPRRPSTSPSESTSTDSSPCQQSHSIPVSLCAPQLNSMAIISRTPISILQLSQVPSVLPSTSAPSHDPLGKLDGGPSPYSQPNRVGPSLHETVDKMQFTESLSALHDLVFELRSEVADLQYRIQATEAKVASFLKIISSMHETLFAEPVDTSPMENPEADKEETQDKMQNPMDLGREWEKRKDDVEEPACKEATSEQWDYGVTYIEEDPWPDDLSATWPTYQPGV